MKVKVIVAHPDDEIIGVGGTIAKHIANGDEVTVLIMAEGKSSRVNSYADFDKTELEKYEIETKNALDELKVSKFKMLNLPNNRLDSIDLLNIVKLIENEINFDSPEIIYTHYYGDINIDHQVVSKATAIACRPLPDCSVKKILMFETLSSTENSLSLNIPFSPNYFSNISNYLDVKINAISKYKSELKKEPHPRNIINIRKNSEVWGCKVGCKAAEAFVVSRIID
ncbi:MAG: PIG-L deacetylase family protein [Sarcina sp.]